MNTSLVIFKLQGTSTILGTFLKDKQKLRFPTLLFELPQMETDRQDTVCGQSAHIESKGITFVYRLFYLITPQLAFFFRITNTH